GWRLKRKVFRSRVARGVWKNPLPLPLSAASSSRSCRWCDCGDGYLVELPPYHNRRVLGKAPLPLVGLERPCTTQVFAGVLLNQAPHFYCTFSRCLGVGHPALDHLMQMTSGDMLKL